MCNINEDLKRRVWNKGIAVKDYDPAKFRQDACGAWMIFEQYSNRKSIYGWEIDHIFPQSILREYNATEKEIDNIDNLRPLNWINNSSKGSDYPSYHADVISDGNKNVRGNYQFQVSEDVQNKLKDLYNKYMQ